jgi:peptidoglycan/LPS O-acetylase OafA/YrhL
MVVILHFVTQGYISSLSFVRNGFLFVDFFFVLSGFVIGSSYGDRIAAGFSVPRFMALRLGRIYPLHLAMLAIFVVFELFFAILVPTAGNRQPFDGIHSIPALIQSLFLVQIFFGPDLTPWNGPSWSIAAELWTYLIFALILHFASRWLLVICALVACVALLILVASTDRYINVFHDGALARCLFGFAIGIAGWRTAAVVRAITLPKWSNDLLEVAMVVAVITFVSTAGGGALTLAAPFVFVCAVLVFSREAGIVSRLLMLSPFVLLGTLSYSIYMTHGFLYYRFLNGLELLGEWAGKELVIKTDAHTGLGGEALFGDAMTFFFLAIVIACSFLTYRFIEVPGQAFVRRLMRGRDDAPLPAAPGAP